MFLIFRTNFTSIGEVGQVTIVYIRKYANDPLKCSKFLLLYLFIDLQTYSAK